jgi:hypothetical protein
MSASKTPVEPLMTVAQIAEYLQRTESWVLREAPALGMKLYGVGRFARAWRHEIDEWVRQHPID